METRSGNLKVSNLIKEIRADLNVLRDGPIHKRSMRQMIDGDDFLKMIKFPPFCRAETVSELKKIISERREELKKLLASIDIFTEGHQFSFEDLGITPVSKELSTELEKQKEQMLKEFKWLHKCLGMCLNKEYFK